MTDRIRLAMVQSRCYARVPSLVQQRFFDDEMPPEADQVADALEYIDTAAEGGADIVAFPEGYPGPSPRTPGLTLDQVAGVLGARARQHRIYVAFGAALKEGCGGFSNVYCLLGKDGDIAGLYRKMIPGVREPSLPGSDIVVVHTEDISIGLLLCWEAWFPELARAVTTEGADLVLYPTGGMVGGLRTTWRTVLAARAAENTVYTASCANVFGVEEGLCCVFGPEGLVSEIPGEGVNYADLDMEQLRWLRGQDECLSLPKKYRCIPGLTRALAGRLEVFDACSAATRQGLARRVESEL